MEKTLTIDGKQVKFKSTAGNPSRYKAQFGRDLFKDLLKMAPLTKFDQEELKNDEEKALEAFQLIDFDMFYNILWTMAKTADNNVPDPITWLDGFEEFPLMDIFPEVQDLLMKNLQTTKKK